MKWVCVIGINVLSDSQGPTFQCLLLTRGHLIFFKLIIFLSQARRERKFSFIKRHHDRFKLFWDVKSTFQRLHNWVRRMIFNIEQVRPTSFMSHNVSDFRAEVTSGVKNSIHSTLLTQKLWKTHWFTYRTWLRSLEKKEWYPQDNVCTCSILKIILGTQLWRHWKVDLTSQNNLHLLSDTFSECKVAIHMRGCEKNKYFVQWNESV